MMNETRFPIQNEIANPRVFMGTIRVNDKYDTTQYSLEEFAKHRKEGMVVLEKLKHDF